VIKTSDWGVSGDGAEIYQTVFVPAMMGEWASRGVALANLRAGEQVLDVACGTGAATRLAARSVGPKGRVVGLDLSSDMLDVASTSAQETAAGPIEWRKADVGALPVDDESFDVVLCAFGLMFFPDRAGALKEMRRVLRPDGRLMLMVWGSMRECPGQLAMKESWVRHFDADAWGLFDRQHSLSDPATVSSIVNKAGFRDSEVHAAMGWVRLPSPEVLARSYGAMAEVQADETTRAAVIAEVSVALKPYVGREGLAYPIQAILANARK
jgi:ubiquinone/menaquinone biosynthesis C-methylase UbiE